MCEGLIFINSERVIPRLAFQIEEKVLAVFL